EDPVDLICLERLPRDRVVTEELIANLIEIVLADIQRQAATPVVAHALEHERASGDELLDAIGPRAQGNLQRRRADIALLSLRIRAFPPALRQDDPLARDHSNLPAARAPP